MYAADWCWLTCCNALTSSSYASADYISGERHVKLDGEKGAGRQSRYGRAVIVDAVALCRRILIGARMQEVTCLCNIRTGGKCWPNFCQKCTFLTSSIVRQNAAWKWYFAQSSSQIRVVPNRMSVVHITHRWTTSITFFFLFIHHVPSSACPVHWHLLSRLRLHGSISSYMGSNHVHKLNTNFANQLSGIGVVH